MILLNVFLGATITTPPSLEQMACVVEYVVPRPEYNFVDDASLQKYVSPKIGLNNERYVPPEMVGLEKVAPEFIEARNNEGRLRREAADALASLAEAFHQQFSKKLVVVSSYRGYAYQKKLLSGYVEKYGSTRAQGFSAKPGHSEHQLGLAIDVFNASTNGVDGYKNFFAWMRAYAYKYGWTQSYQKGAAIDGYVIEPWHWRYVGVELATYLWKNKMTFSEYVAFEKIRNIK